MPAGKAIAIAAMPTAVLMGMGFTPTLAQADDHSTATRRTAVENPGGVAAVTDSEDDKDASDTASPSATPSASESSGEATPTPSASAESADPGKTSSSDSGSDDKAEPAPSTSSSAASTSDKAADTSVSTPTPAASESSTNPLDPLGVGDAIKDILTPDETASATPAPSASASAGETTAASEGKSADTVEDTTDKVVDKAEGTVEDTTDAAAKAAEKAEAAEKAAADAATATPSPSASATTDASDCPVATDDEGGVDNPVTLPTDPWYLNASSLLLKGADYQGVVKVRTADGTVKKVLKYVISDGTDIGDLHQTVEDKQAGKTYHVQAAKGSTSTIRGGKTIMYTESISGNLLGLIPVTFDPDNPPPLNIPLIYFTKVTVVQAGQFGGTLTVPGLHQYATG
jgi:hypothetical protein